MSNQTKKKIAKKFKQRGYVLNLESLTSIVNFVSKFQVSEDESIDLVLDEIRKETLNSSIIDKDSINRVISKLLQAYEVIDSIPSSSSNGGFGSGSGSGLRVIDSFVMPKFRFDSIKKSFYEYTGKLPIHGDAAAKAGLYRDRFELLLQRISRDPHFSKPAFDPDMTYSATKSTEISPIQSLIGHTGIRWIMGVISQLEDGHFYLEDLTASVEVNLSDASITAGFFAENTVIVAEGQLLPSGIFQVSTCGFPPLEDRDTSITTHVGLDFFGGGFLSADETRKLEEFERNAVNEMFIIFSDVWLDNPETMENIAIVLDGYESLDVVPSLFVFMGNFCSRPCNIAFNSYSSLRSQFGKLGEMIVAHKNLMEHSRFLFIPGPDDGHQQLCQDVLYLNI